MKTTILAPFTPLQLSALLCAVTDRASRLAYSTEAATAGHLATDRYQDSAAALALDTDRYELLATKLGGVSPLTRDDLEHALVAACIARRVKACSTDRTAAMVLGGVVSLLTDTLADEALEHDEY